jgi:hypothetical protein
MAKTPHQTILEHAAKAFKAYRAQMPKKAGPAHELKDKLVDVAAVGLAGIATAKIPPKHAETIAGVLSMALGDLPDEPAKAEPDIVDAEFKVINVKPKGTKP